MPSKLEHLRAMTVVVADTGDLDAVRRLKPQDCTTNPTLILKAVETPAYAAPRRRGPGLGATARRLARGASSPRSATASPSRSAPNSPAIVPGPGVDGGRCGPVLRHRRHPRQGAATHRGLRGAGHRARAHPGQDRLHLGGHPRGGRAPEGGHRLQPHAAVLPGAGAGLRGGGRLSDLALRRPHPRLAREGGRRALYGRDRSRRAVGARDLRILQGAGHRDRRDGRVLPQYRRDRGPGGLRPAHDLAGPAR